MTDAKRKLPSFTSGDRLVLVILCVAVSVVLVLRHGMAAGVGRPEPALTRESKADNHLIDLNRAPWWELQALQGIGEKRAKDIVAFRDRAGGFKSVDDLIRAPGIGPKTLERLRPYLTADGPESTNGENR